MSGFGVSQEGIVNDIPRLGDTVMLILIPDARFYFALNSKYKYVYEGYSKCSWSNIECAILETCYLEVR